MSWKKPSRTIDSLPIDTLPIKKSLRAKSPLAWALYLLAMLLPATSLADLRIVSADGAVTEIIFALDAQAALVGVDSTSLFPAEARALPKVGYRRTLTAEGILTLNPNRVIITAEAGPPTTLAHLQKSGVQISQLPLISQPEQVAERIVQVAQWLNADAKGRQLQQNFLARLQQIYAQRSPTTTKKVLFLLAAGPRGLMMAGKDTQAQVVLNALGMENVATELTSYKPFNQEAVMNMAPETVIVAETHPGAFQLAQWPSLQATPAAQTKRIVVLDSMYLLGFGPRLVDALANIQSRLQTTIAQQ